MSRGGVDDGYVYMRTVLGPRVTNELERRECSKPDLDTYHHETRERKLIPRRTIRDQGHSMQWPGTEVDGRARYSFRERDVDRQRRGPPRPESAKKGATE